ncbi:hypothetical protein [Bifidobacterium pseudolongum]
MYRGCSKNHDDHLRTLSSVEKDTAARSGWHDESIAFSPGANNS